MLKVSSAAIEANELSQGMHMHTGKHRAQGRRLIWINAPSTIFAPQAAS
jgi:hypothetical protein